MEEGEREELNSKTAVSRHDMEYILHKEGPRWLLTAVWLYETTGRTSHYNGTAGWGAWTGQNLQGKSNLPYE